MISTGWSWSIFVAGLAVTMASLLAHGVISRALLRLDPGDYATLRRPPSAEQTRTVRAVLVLTNLSLVILAAGLRLTGLVVFMAVGVLLAQVLLPLIAWRKIKRGHH